MTSFDFPLKLLQPAALLVSFPCRKTGIEYVVHLLQCVSLGLGGGQRHVNEGRSVEGTEYVVHLV